MSNNEQYLNLKKVKSDVLTHHWSQDDANAKTFAQYNLQTLYFFFFKEN